VISAAAVLAHQGGRDEVLFVVVPMIVLVWLLALAQRRAAADNEADREPQHEAGRTASLPPERDR